MGHYMKSKLSAVCRLTIFLSLLGALILSNSSTFAQSESDGQPLLRGARLPASPSDTGAAFDEMEHLRAAGEYFKARATSGDVKDWGEVLRIGYDAWSKVGNSIAYKAEGTPAWLPIAGALADNGGTPHASGRSRDIAFDPTNANIGYLAAAQGGIWKTTNLIINYQPALWARSLSIRTMAAFFMQVLVKYTADTVLLQVSVFSNRWMAA